MRILIADHQAIFRSGVRDVLAATGEMRVVAEAGDAAEAVALTVRFQPDVVILSLSGTRGAVTAIREIKSQVAATRVLVLTDSEQEVDPLAALAAGADGYLFRNIQPQELVRAVRQTGEGAAPLAPRTARKVLEHLRDHWAAAQAWATSGPLTPRELEVVRLVALGWSYKEVARILRVAESTVKNHMRHVMDKLDARNRAEVTRLALRGGLLADDRKAGLIRQKEAAVV